MTCWTDWVVPSSSTRLILGASTIRFGLDPMMSGKPLLRPRRGCTSGWSCRLLLAMLLHYYNKSFLRRQNVGANRQMSLQINYLRQHVVGKMSSRVTQKPYLWLQVWSQLYLQWLSSQICRRNWFVQNSVLLMGQSSFCNDILYMLSQKLSYDSIIGDNMSSQIAFLNLVFIY